MQRIGHISEALFIQAILATDRYFKNVVTLSEVAGVLHRENAAGEHQLDNFLNLNIVSVWLHIY